VADFAMPVDVFIDGKEVRLFATDEWQKLKKEVKTLEDIRVNELEFYVSTGV